MSKYLKFLKKLLGKGFATAEEKAELAALYKELEADEQETVKEDNEKAEALPEKDPQAADDEAEVEKGVRDLINRGIHKGLQETRDAIKAMQDEVSKWLEEQKALAEKKSGIYHPEVQEKRKGLNAYIRKFSQALLDNDMATVKELTTDASGAPFGGYAVDSELSAEIRHLTTEYGVARKEMTTLPLSKNSYKANELVTDVTIFWVDEGGVIKSTEVELGQKELTLKKLGAIVTLTRELLQDEEVDLFAFVGTRVAEGFAQAEDEAFFIGDGTATYGGFTGIMNDAGINNVPMAAGETSFNDLTADHLWDMIAKAPQSVRRTGKFYMQFSIMGIVRKLKDSNGDYIYQRPSENGPATVWGRPVVEVEVMPSTADTAVSTPFVLYGDLKKSSIFGFRGGMAMDRFNAGVVRNVADNADVNLITTDREAVRWIERVGVMHIIPKAVVKLTTAAA